MIRVGFYLENKNIPNVDLSKPYLGNPGCGGTEYLFTSLPYYLEKKLKERCHPIILANIIDKLPTTVERVKVDGPYEAVRTAKQIGCDLIVYRPKRSTEMDLVDLCSELDLPIIMWVHVIPSFEYIDKIAKNDIVKAFVCVEREQHDRFYDERLYRKLTYIVNGFDLDGFRSELEGHVNKDPNLVVHIGTLVPQKNFQVLAKAWPEVIMAHPEAKLVVIGSGDVYGNDISIGPWGIASDSYERTYVMPYLSGGDGRPHPSVQFMGKMGLEKKRLLASALVGVPNPTGDNENCPGTNLEISAAGTAVVSGARYGSLDTVLHMKTGLLGARESQLATNIIRLLKDPSRAELYGRNGIDFVRQRYDFSLVCLEWQNLFTRILSGQTPQKRNIKKNLLKHHKILRVINRPIQKFVGGKMYWPSIDRLKYEIQRRMMDKK